MIPPNTYCDRCPQRAVMHVTTRNGPIYLCSHHHTKHQHAIYGNAAFRTCALETL